MAQKDRKDFLHHLGAELDAIDAQLDQYETEFRGENAQGDRPRTNDSLGTLQQQRQSIRERSRELEDVDGREWEMRRREIEAARDDLKRSLARARNEMRH